MSLEALVGQELDSRRTVIAAAKSAEYVAATGDDPDRWVEYAPPSFAGALLFVAAPALLEHADVRASTKVLVHVDQVFRWHRPLRLGEPITLVPTVSKVRTRGASNFVTFDVAVDDSNGRLLDSVSTFLLGSEPAAPPGTDRGEPPAGAQAANESPGRVQHAGPGSQLPSLAKSASRVDLVRYAGASGDFNPIHYDHEAARQAGLDGIVVHGLLMGAWLAQLAGSTSQRPDPLAELRLRFRSALAPAVQAVATGTVRDTNDDGCQRIDLTLGAGEADLVTGHATVRSG